MYQTVIFVIGVVLFAWFVSPIPIFGIFNVGNILGMLTSAVLIIYGFKAHIINLFVASIYRTLIGKMLIFVTICILLAGIVFVVVATMRIVNSTNTFKNGTQTTVVVLGCRVKDDGPGAMLSERIDAAYRFLSKNPEAKCILSGGKGSDEPISEAECMYNHLVDMGMSAERLYLEDRSTSTEENICFSQKVIKDNELCESITVITNGFHAYRALSTAKKAGMECFSYSAETNFVLLPTYYVRELLCIAHEQLF